MTLLSNLRIGRRIGLAFLLTLLLMLVVAVFSASRLVLVNASLRTVTQDYYAKVRLIAKIDGEINKQARYMRNALIMQPGPERDREVQSIAQSRTVVREGFDKLAPLVRREDGRQQLAQVLAARADYVKGLDAFLAHMQGGAVEEARALLLQSQRAQQLRYMEAMGRFAALHEQLMAQASQEADRDAQRGLWVTACVSVVALLVSAILGVLLTRSITRPLSQAVQVAQSVAAGDLTSQVDARSRDEVGQLLQALQSMNTALVDLVGQVHTASESIVTGATEIASGSVDLSQRTEEQASNLEQTAASMEQLAVTVRQNADSARTAVQWVQEAAVAAQQCGDTVARVVTTMGDIGGDSRRIESIVDTIDGIAFQTNILALNAAVEAARAGEQGRGFAVVASEVRSLAQRSATAAKEIKSLIEGSAQRVASGNALASAAGDTAKGVVDQVARVSRLIEQIGMASAEQTSGIGQVSDAVQQLDRVTQQNAALVEESTAASESLRSLAQELTVAVSVFQLPEVQGRDDVPTAPRHVPTPLGQQARLRLAG